MDISKETVNELLRIKNSYGDIYEELNTLEHEMVKLNSEKDNIILKLYGLRDSEKELINKIEEDLGRKITTDELSEILKNA